MTLNLDWILVEMAFVVATALLGFIKGWKYMAIWTVAVFFSTIVASKIGPQLERLLNKVVSVGAEFIAIGLGRADNSVTAPTLNIPDANQPLAVAVFFLVLVLFSIWIARKLGNAIDIGIAGKLFGAIFGALGTILVLSELANYYKDYVTKSGKDPLASNFTLGIPTVTLGLGGSSGANDWASLGTLAMAMFLMLLVVYVIWRVVRTVL